MAITSLKELRKALKKPIPRVLLTGKFNFLTVHYLYLLANVILFSVIIYGIGGLAYIDALFFASGACTQSGLNTIDVDLLSTGQQFCLYMAAMLCNPISIHSSVVFIRLYWFEKRFKDVVSAAQSLRRSKSKSRQNTISREDPEEGREPRGVRGRAIRILRNTGQKLERNEMDEKADVHVNGNGKATAPSNTSSRRNSDQSRNGSIKFGRGRRSTTQSDDEVYLPQRVPTEHHIRFVENQRHPDEDDVLRIPGPREFERGGRPENVRQDSDEDVALEPVSPQMTRQSQQLEEPRVGDQGRPHITIDEPSLTKSRQQRSTGLYRPPTTQSLPAQNQDDPAARSHRRVNSFGSLRKSQTMKSGEGAPYLSWQPTVGRNSFFVDLTEEQREELGGIEYRALKTLALVLVLYFFLFHIFGVICLIPWILKTYTWGQIIEAQGQGRVWWAVFTSASAFNDLGFTLTNNSMISFEGAVFPLLLMSFLIVIGNTGFPFMLRFVLWAASKLVPVGSGIWEELHFLLDHPRRCFTLLFPRAATWWLFAVLVILNGMDLLFFIVLDLNDSTVESIPGGLRFVNGLFQAFSTRTAGFAVVNLADLHPAIQVSYLIMMYISVFPIAISMRRTNVYEERSLGIYSAAEDEDDEDKNPSYVSAHVRKQLSFDLWFIFLGLFVIAIVEGGQIQNPANYAFNMFAILFEIVSAYGTVGLSLGYPTINASFSAEFHVLSKLVIIAMQIRGRHRGLPYQLDRAIMLPSESNQEKEKREAERIMSRRGRRFSGSLSNQPIFEEPDNYDNPTQTGRNTAASSGRDPDVESLRQRESNVQHPRAHEMAEKMVENHHSHARKDLGQGLSWLAGAHKYVKSKFTKPKDPDHVG